MSNVFYKKPNGEVFRFELGRMKKSSCDAKYVLCDASGKEVKQEAPKKASKKKEGK